MALPMTRPTKHPKSGVYRIRIAVPAALRGVIGKRERVETLGTKDPKEALKLAPAIIAKIGAEFTAALAAAGSPVRLTNREVMALCGDWYRAFVGHWEDDPGDPDDWAAFAALMVSKLEDVSQHGPIALKQERHELAEARSFLATKGIPADVETARRFALALMETKHKAAETLRRRGRGDYSPDPHVTKFPAPKPEEDRRPPLPAEELLAVWAADRNPAAATRAKYAGCFRQLARVLGFDDVRRITPDHVVKFKQARQAEGRDNGTIADDVLACGAVCNWAVKHRLLTENPFAGLAPEVNRRGPAPVAPYDDDDAVRILKKARAETGWLRWAPWLLCFTGARISEIAALRRGDVRQDGGVWILDIKPLTGRPGKNGTFQRMIPLHPAVIAEGFLGYVFALPSDPTGPLFPSIRPDLRGGRVIPATTLMARWVRRKVGISDPTKVPAHSWRHRMEDELRKVRALPEVQDAITGRHNPRNAGAGYGKGYRGMPGEVLRDLERVPSPILPKETLSEVPKDLRETAAVGV